MLSSPSANRCVLVRWMSVALCCLLAGAALWYGCDQLFFASARVGHTCASGAAATQTRVWIEWFIGCAPGIPARRDSAIFREKVLRESLGLR